MGFDVTMHPFSTKEFKYYFEDVLLDNTKIESRLLDIHNEESERTFLRDAIYSRLEPLKSQVLSGELEFENSVGFGMCAIFGFLHPYWYSRNGMLTQLFELEDLKKHLGIIAHIASDENKILFDKSMGALNGNYSSGVFIPSDNIKSIVEYLNSEQGEKASIDIIGPDNFSSLMNCLSYCVTNGLHVMEASDLVVPFSGESNTFPPNFRAKHLKNVDNHENNSKSKKLKTSLNPEPKPKKGFWSRFKRD